MFQAGAWLQCVLQSARGLEDVMGHLGRHERLLCIDQQDMYLTLNEQARGTLARMSVEKAAQKVRPCQYVYTC